MERTRTGTGWARPRPELIDEAFDAYLQWRDESAAVWHAYRRWASAPAGGTETTFWAYRAALDREEQAAGVYRRLLGRLEG